MIKFIGFKPGDVCALYSRYDVPLYNETDYFIGVIATTEGQPIPMDVIERIKKEIDDGRTNL